RPEAGQAGGEVRRQAYRAEEDHLQPDRLVRGEGSGSDQAAEASARLLAVASAQPLCADRSFARRVREVRPGPQQAARSHHTWRRGGPAQGKLVRKKW